MSPSRRLGRVVSSLSVLVVLSLGAACTQDTKKPLGAESPLAEREDELLVVRWAGAPAGSRLPIFAGPAPDQIDRTSPVAHLERGRAEIRDLPFAGRPYLEIALPDGGTHPLAERQIPLEGAANFRDLGGYRTVDGRQTQWGRVFRSGQLSDLSDEDVATLDDLGISLVCDFRSPAEREARPDRLPEADPPAVLNAEIYTPGVDPSELESKIISGDLDDVDLPNLLVEGNRAFVTKFSDRYRAMFDHLLEEKNLPAVLHCTAGKDRAGMAAALVLLAVGVPEEVVMQDFLLTNHYTHDDIQRSLAIIWVASLFRSNPGEVEPLLRVEPRYLQAGFDAMRQQNGSIDAYLRDALGLTDEKREKLKALLLQP